MDAQRDPGLPHNDRPRELCRYPSKKCWELRVRKRNGQLHQLCEYHRQRANANQRRMEQKRVEQRRAQMRACLGVGYGLVLTNSHVHHAKNLTADSQASGLETLPPTRSAEAGMDDELVDLDIQLDAAMDCMIYESDGVDESFDTSADLCEADLLFCDQFIA